MLDRDEIIVFIVKEAWYFPNTQHSLPSGQYISAQKISFAIELTGQVELKNKEE
jgi:hypothetical protein